MRTEDEVRIDLLKLKKPLTRVWPPMSAAEQEALRAWAENSPDAAKRHAELEAELEAIFAEGDRQRAAKGLRSDLHAAGVGLRTLDVVCVAAAPTPAIDATRDWLKSGKTWLLLSGDVGTGKSIAAAYALKHAIEAAPYGAKSAFRRASGVVRMSAFDEGARELEFLKSASMLVIDDLGTEHATSWGQSLIHEIFDTRHDDRRRTIITTNIKREQLKAALGDRLSDRIAQDGKVVCLEGKSMRRTPPEAT